MKNEIEVQLACCVAGQIKNQIDTLSKLFKGDLLLAQVWFHALVEEQEQKKRDPSANKVDHYNARLTIYHLSKITQLDRATVRRKLLKLKEMNLVDRNDDGTWVSVSASNNPVAGQATAELMNNALTGVREFNQIVN